MSCFVYKIECKTNGKSYIGISNNPERRFKEHMNRAYYLDNSQYDSYLNRSIRKYGKDDFELTVLIESDRNYCGFIETKCIEAYNTRIDGFNGSSGGEGTDCYQPWNKETKGLCKPNSASFKKGRIPPTTKLNTEEINRLIHEYQEGLQVFEMKWLTISSGQAYRVLNREGVLVTKNNLYFRGLKMLEMYESGLTQRRIAEILGVHFKTVNYYITKTKEYRLTNDINKKPNASSSDLVGVSPSREPLAANAFLSEGRAGSFLIKNHRLQHELQLLGLDTPEIWAKIEKNRGSIQGIKEIPEWLWPIYKTFGEIDPKWIIELASIAQEHVCQGMSNNIKVGKDITLQEMSDIHILAWAKKLKGMYYCRAEKATQTSSVGDIVQPLNKVNVDINFEECLSCSG